MAQNFIQEGTRIPYTNSTGSTIASGAPVFIGGSAFIALESIADTESGMLATHGVWRLPKKAPLVIAQGDLLFWDSTSGEVTKTVTDVPLGMAFAAEVSAATTVDVFLNEAGEDRPQAANVANLGAFSNLSGVDGTGSNAAPLAGVNTEFGVLHTKIDAILTAVKNAGIMIG